MKKVDINVLVLKSRIRRDVDIKKDVSQINYYPKDIYEFADSNKMFSELTEFKILGVSSYVINDDKNKITQTAQISIPKKNTILNKVADDTYSHILFSTGHTLFLKQQVIIQAGYNNNLQTRFIGFVSNFKVSENAIIISLEDSMYNIKNSISLKKNFPKKINGEDLNIYHITEYIVKQLYEANKTNRNILVPKVRTFNSTLGKVFMNEYFNPAEVLNFLIKDMYDMLIFFRNEYVLPEQRDINLGSLMEPVLYVGWGNWNELEYVEHRIEGDKVLTDKKNFTTQDNEDNTNRAYSYNYSFMYPYRDSLSSEYNPIVTHNLEFSATKKLDISIKARSFIAETNEEVTVNYAYGKFLTKEELKEETIEEEKDREGTNLTQDADSIEVKNANLGSKSNINLFYPNIDEDALKEKINNYLQSFSNFNIKGSFTTIGEPYLRQGDIVTLRIDLSSIKGVEAIISDSGTQNLLLDSNDSTVISVKHYVESVTNYYDNNGMKQVVTLGKKV